MSLNFRVLVLTALHPKAVSIMNHIDWKSVGQARLSVNTSHFIEDRVTVKMASDDDGDGVYFPVTIMDKTS